MTDALLRIDGLVAAYGSIRAVHGVDISVDEGELVALLGSNGAGKSTTLKSIVGVVKPVGGTIRFKGEDITGKAPEQIVKRGISLVPEGRDIFGALTVEENLRLGAFAVYERKQYQEDLAEVFELFPVLRERFSQPAGQLSGGEQQMLAIGRALMSHPKLLMLDEPSLGLSPAMTDVIFDLIVRLRQRGATILLVEQNAERALEIVDRAYLFANGRVEFEGTPQQIRDRVDVAAVYFGDGADGETCEVDR